MISEGRKEEAKLVRKAARGDRSAFAGIVESYQRAIYYFAFRLTGNHDDADDVSQMTFLKAFQNLSRFDPGTNLRAWLLAIAANTSTDLYRRKGTRREVALADDSLAPPSREENPEASAMDKETGALVWLALDCLPSDQRAVLVLHGMEGIPLADIAREMNWPEGTVRWRYHQARLRMKERLKGTELDFELEPAVDGEKSNG